MSAVSTTCSACRVTVTLEAGHATAGRPSNGRRGAGHVPAGVVRADTWEVDGVVFWDCPVCGHADSFDPDA